MSPQYDAVHTRTLAFVDDDYWVVHDRLRASSAHDYTARWHLDRHAEARVAVRRGHGQTVVTTPPARFVVPTGFGDVGLGPGWVSPAYGVKHAAPVVLVTADGRPDADLVTVIVPGADVPRSPVRHLDDGVLVAVEPAARHSVRLHLAPTWASLESGRGSCS